jgi:predicted lipid carrier protein YhbT
MILTKEELKMLKRRRAWRRRKEKLRKKKAELEVKEIKLTFFLFKKKAEKEFSWRCKVEVE